MTGEVIVPASLSQLGGGQGGGPMGGPVRVVPQPGHSGWQLDTRHAWPGNSLALKD